MLYNHTTKSVITRAQIISALPSITRKSTATDSQLINWASEHLGWHISEVVPFIAPEGMVTVGAVSIIIEDGIAKQHYNTITIEEHEEQQRILKEIEEKKRQNNKSKDLKSAENDFISFIYYINGTYNLNILPEDGFKEVLIKIDSSPIERIDKVELGLKLRTLWDVVLYHGGKWGDIQFHDMSI